MMEAHKFLADFKKDAERYAEIVKRTEAGTATLEELQMIRTRSGQRAKVEAITEKIYPTEYEPPRGHVKPDEASDPDKPEEAPGNALPYPCPTAFETRNTGTTLEIEPVMSADAAIIDLTVAPEIVKFLGDDPMTPDRSQKQPKFQTQKLSVSLTLKPGQPALLGTQSPPHLSGVEGANTEKTVWLSFLTAEIIPVE